MKGWEKKTRRRGNYDGWEYVNMMGKSIYEGEEATNLTRGSPLQRPIKLSAVFGTTLPYSPMITLPAGKPLISTSKNTLSVTAACDREGETREGWSDQSINRSFYQPATQTTHQPIYESIDLPTNKPNRQNNQITHQLITRITYQLTRPND